MIAYLGSLKPPSITPPPVTPYNLDYVAVAGGGGGAGADGALDFANGGGGAGGYLSGTLTAQTVAVYDIYIGAGGVGNDAAGGRFSTGGSNTFFQSNNSFIFAIGGGSSIPRNGGSGAGAHRNNAVGLGTAGQGNNGGSGQNVFGYVGGGGGAGEAGATGGTTAKGGDGLTWVDSITRAGGGGGNRTAPEGGGPYLSGSGGAGGGGRGANSVLSIFAEAGTVNTGGGGGAGWPNGGGADFQYTVGGNGGSGVVKVRYLGTPRATGGTITQDGGYTYHEFTSSGRLTFTS
jgi:hypothetical protein